MAMDRKRVTMIRAEGQLVIGNSYLLPHALADSLIAKGTAKDEQKPGPQQVKPAGPSTNKVVAPSAVKTPAKNA